MTRVDRARLLWVTNLAAPYRLPVWEDLGRKFELRVGLLESSARMNRDKGANRGSDWGQQVGSTYRIVEYPTLRVARGEDRHYALVTPHPVRDLARSDVVLLGGWDSPGYWQLLAAAKALRKPTVGFYESTLASQGRSEGRIAAARSKFFTSLDAVVVPGPAARDAILAMGVPEGRICTGFNAVDVNAFAAAPPADPHEGHRFLYVGQLIERKNVDGIIDAFSRVAEPDDTLTVIGRGDLREQHMARTESAGLSSQVTFVDYLPYASLPAEMRKHDTLVLASHVEVWGLVVNEALASGMQVVVTQNCGVAPSVAGMQGVFVGPATDLEPLMIRARDEYTGRIDDPEILQHTPEAFAQVFATAFDRALSRSGGHGGGVAPTAVTEARSGEGR